MRACWDYGRDSVARSALLGLALADEGEGGGDFFLHLLAGLEFDDGAGRDRHIFAGILGVTADLGFGFLDLEGTKVTHDDGVSVGKRVSDRVECLLDDIEDLLLGQTRFIADFDDELAFGNSGHGCERVGRTFDRHGGLRP